MILPETCLRTKLDFFFKVRLKFMFAGEKSPNRQFQKTNETSGFGEISCRWISKPEPKTIVLGVWSTTLATGQQGIGNTLSVDNPIAII